MQSSSNGQLALVQDQPLVPNLLLGVASSNKQSDLCLSHTHEARDSALLGEGDHNVGLHLRAIESSVLTMVSGSTAMVVGVANRVGNPEICHTCS